MQPLRIVEKQAGYQFAPKFIERIAVILCCTEIINF